MLRAWLCKSSWFDTSSGPEPGGWNRIIVQTDSLDRDVATLRNAGVQFRSEFMKGPGGRQILAEDPSGNLVEMFEPAADSK